MNHHLQQRWIYCFRWQRDGRVVRDQRAKLWHWLNGCFEANASGLTVRDQGICLCEEKLGIIESTGRTRPSLRLSGKDTYLAQLKIEVECFQCVFVGLAASAVREICHIVACALLASRAGVAHWSALEKKNW